MAGRAPPTERWAKRYGGDFGLAMRFLDASRNKREAQRQAEEQHRRKYVEIMGGSADKIYQGAGAALSGGVALSPGSRRFAKRLRPVQWWRG